jgi:hypothetical protein
LRADSLGANRINDIRPLLISKPRRYPLLLPAGGIEILNAHLDREISPARLAKECDQCRHDFRRLPDLRS